MTTLSTHQTDASVCDPRTAVTKSLLGYGVLAGPLYVTVSVAQTLTRDGFDLRRHAWSLLANGAFGWIQVVNLILAGLMVVAFSIGLRRALAGGAGATWAPRLIAVYGVSLVVAGIFRADPALGFPAGTPVGPSPVSWHGMLHFASGAVGFTCLTAACFVVARRYSREGRRTAATASRAVGVVFLGGFAMVAASGGAPVGNLAFTGAVVAVWAWLAVVAVDRYRQVSAQATDVLR